MKRPMLGLPAVSRLASLALAALFAVVQAQTLLAQAPPVRPIVPGNQPLEGSGRINLMPSLPSVPGEAKPPADGISCEAAQARYANVVARINMLRDPGLSVPAGTLGNRQTEDANLNGERQRLEQYMTWTLKKCALPKLALRPPLAACTPNGRTCSRNEECCSKSCAVDPKDPLAGQRCR